MPLASLRAWTGARLGPVEVLAAVDSTNAEALRRVDAGAARDGLVLVAERQEAGRGSRGRTWDHRPGKSLAISALLRASDALPPHLATWTAAVAVTDVALAHGLAASIKWPNDGLLHADRARIEPGGGGKFAGVLVESRAAAGSTWSAIGIGVNVGHAEDDFIGEFRRAPTSLRLHGVDLPLETALVELLAALDRRLAAAPAEVVSDFAERLGLVGRRVVATLPDREERGTLVEVGLDGRLRLDGPGGGRLLQGGHVVALGPDASE